MLGACSFWAMAGAMPHENRAVYNSLFIILWGISCQKTGSLYGVHRCASFRLPRLVGCGLGTAAGLLGRGANGGRALSAGGGAVPVGGGRMPSFPCRSLIQKRNVCQVLQILFRTTANNPCLSALMVKPATQPVENRQAVLHRYVDEVANNLNSGPELR